MRINSPYITGSAIITGNLCVQGTITGTITGIASTASYAETLDGLDSTQFVQTGSFNTYTSSAASNLSSLSGSIATTTLNLSSSVSSSIGSLSGSIATTTSNLSSSVGSLSGSVSTTTSNLSSSIGSLSSSVATTTSNLSSSLGSLSGSVATTTLNLSGRITTIEGRYATTGSNIFVGNQVITGSVCATGNIVTTGQIVAQTINVQQVTSSIVYSCGSNIFGNSSSNTHQFTGSISAIGTGVFGNTGAGAFSLAITNNDQSNSRIRLTNTGTGGSVFSLVAGNPGASNAGFGVFDENCSATRMYFNSTGNVGIGCNTPTNSRLLVAGTHVSNNSILGVVPISNNTATIGLYNSSGSRTALFYSDTGFVTIETSTDPLLLRTEGQDRLRITSGGISCFACRVCVAGLTVTGDMCFGIGTGAYEQMVMCYSGFNGGNPITTLMPTQLPGSGALTTFLLLRSNGLGLGNTGCNHMGLHVQSTAYLASCNGRVGIGTTSPGTALEVFSRAADADRTIPHNVLTITAEQGNAPYGFFGGSILFKNRSYTTGMVESARIRSVIHDDGAPFNCGGGLWFESTSTPGGTLTPALAISYTGRVGIGCVLPNYHLEVRCAASTSSCYLAAMFSRTTGAANGVGDVIAFGANGVSSIAGIFRTIGSWGLELQTANQNTRMRIDNSGNVGINTLTPAQLLDVRSACTSGASGATIRIGSQNHGGSGDEFANLEFYWGDPDSEGVKAKIYAKNVGNVGPGGGGAADLLFATTPAFGSSTERMRITNGGQVAIGNNISTSSEANLFLGAQGTIEGGQLVLQRGTSCSCATHLDNYNDTFRILSGTDTGSTGVNMTVNHKTGTVNVSCTLSITTPTLHGIKTFNSGITSAFTINLVNEFPETLLVGGNVWGVMGKALFFNAGAGEIRDFVIARNSAGSWANANYGPSSCTSGGILQSVVGSGTCITINMNSNSYVTVELTAMVR